MRLIDARPPQRREHPYVVTLAPDRNVRWPLTLTEEAQPSDRWHAHAFHVPGALDPGRRATEAGRRVVIEGMRRKAKTGAASYCIVWAKDECTFLLRDGGTIEGRRPPRAEPACPEDYEAVNAHLVSIDWIELSEDHACSHLCVRNLCADRVEIASGAPVALGHFDELPLEGPGSELRRYLDEAGLLVAPATFRGARVTGMTNHGTLLGPVQPDGRAFRVVQPWPSEVFAACEEIAGRRLPEDLLTRAWHAVNPLRTGYIRSGVREAACRIASVSRTPDLRGACTSRGRTSTPCTQIVIGTEVPTRSSGRTGAR